MTAGECAACAVGLFATCGPTSECFHTHPQVLVRYPLVYDLATSRAAYLVAPRAGDGIVNVDAGCLALLESLWTAGVRTWVSCQDAYGSKGYVSYHSDDHHAAMDIARGAWPDEEIAVSHTTAGGLPHSRIGFPSN